MKYLHEVLPNYKVMIGVMGSASGYLMRNEDTIKKARKLGAQIAKHEAVLVNGACPGLPNEAAIGAKEAGGTTLGVSPGFSIASHIKKYKSPVKPYDHILFTGMGLMMRDIINIRSSNAVVILPGGTGTLNEFTVAYDEGKPIGVLTGADGCAEYIKEILEFCHRDITDRMIFDDDPEALIDRLIEVAEKIRMSCGLDDYLLGDNGVVTQIEEVAEKGATNGQRPTEGHQEENQNH